MIKTKAIDHVCLWVRSLEETKAYYETLFGFIFSLREGDESAMVVESQNVHFFISESEPNEFLSKQHIAFRVDSIDEVVSTLDELNISHNQGEVNFFRYNNYKWCEWRDPSGIRVECVEVK
jgi:catechol 2,3-dioxygenase-like lactoylglutathione lyase family enzyme